MIIREYPILCTQCFGSGKMKNPDFDPNVTGSPQEIVCKVCNGVGMVTVKENIYDQYDSLTGSADFKIDTDAT